MNLLTVLLASMMAMASPHPHAMMTHGHAMKAKNTMHSKSAMHSNAMHAKKHAMMHGHMAAKPTPKP